MNYTITLGSEQSFAHTLLSLMKKEGLSVLLLSGNLGAGKTTLTQAIARELGIREQIISPTFVIERRYSVPEDSEFSPLWKTLIHIDAYRFENHEEGKILKLEELAGDPKNLIVIEWPERLLFSTISENVLHIKLSHDTENTRIAEIPKEFSKHL